MTTINNAGQALQGAGGTGKYVGSNDSQLLGHIDCGTATSLTVPNSNAPTVSTKGDFAIDKLFTNFSGMMTYFDTAQRYCPAILAADIDPTDGYIVAYNLALQKFKMQKQSGLVQFVIFTDTADGGTSSATMVDTTLTANITPNNANNKILIMVYACDITTVGINNLLGYANYDLRRTTGTATTLATTSVGVDNGAVENTDTRSIISMCAYETAGSTSTHTYVLRHSVPSTSLTSTYKGTFSPTMILLEMLP